MFYKSEAGFNVLQDKEFLGQAIGNESQVFD